MSEHVITYKELQKKIVQKTVTIELLPCPFCGDAAGFSDYRYGSGVVCKGCKSRTPLRGGADRHLRAAEVWNRRTTP